MNKEEKTVIIAFCMVFTIGIFLGMFIGAKAVESGIRDGYYQESGYYYKQPLGSCKGIIYGNRYECKAEGNMSCSVVQNDSGLYCEEKLEEEK